MANNLTEAWAALKFGRCLEFNLEGRRLGELTDHPLTARASRSGAL